MKTLTLTVAALSLSASASFAQEALFQGCEVKAVPNGNYFNLVDPTCEPDGTGFFETSIEDERQAAAQE